MEEAARERFRKRLSERLAALRTASGVTEEDRRPVQLDQSSVGRLSRMDAMQVQAMAQAAERRRSDEVRRIEAALQRIAEDEYGWCLRCGEAIAVPRLEADPTATLCIGCAGSS
ncbi:TraR/DksA family transcriptional regulator [Marinibaculum pumilum]|uniref:TraR/DksA family transcriptional regulator n=1 Tax=Marinibaculum pumilum TaxID=1766165 RepID=A0ABV7KZJ9_9PROT